MNRLAPKILIIDDDPQIVRVLRVTLEDAHFHVSSAHNGEEGLRAAYDQHPDLILLDIVMPGMDGFQVLEHLHAVTDVPVIMLTGFGQDSNQIRAMDKGAVDFITKGGNMDVLISRIHARLRHREEHHSSQGPRHFDSQLEIDVPRRWLRVGNEPVNLTPLQWRLLVCLVENEGHVSTYRKLLNVGWDNPDFGDVRAVKVQISILREKLHDSARKPHYIHTIREEGYLFDVRND